MGYFLYIKWIKNTYLSVKCINITPKWVYIIYRTKEERLFPIYFFIYYSEITPKWSEKGLYTFKLPSEKAMRKVKVGKTVALKTNNNYRKHKDCVACGTCKHSFPHKGEHHNFSDCIDVK